MLNKHTPPITVYAVGGTGINIARQLKNLDLNVVYIDTSISNIRGGEDDGSVYLLEGLDGAGKHRTPQLYERFKEEMPKILLRHKPSESLNIVIASLAGGSGSTGAPAVVDELLMQGKNFIVIGLESLSSPREMENTLNTLQSFRLKANKFDKPVSMFYIEHMPFREGDRHAIGFVNLMSTVIDKSRTDGFDVANITSFLYFNRVTKNKPALSIIELSDNTELLPEKGTSVVGTVFVTKDRNEALRPVEPDYLTICVVTDPTFTENQLRINSVLGKSSIHVENLQSRIKAAEEQKKINGLREAELPKSDDNAMVF